jgi:hypothetical protein
LSAAISASARGSSEKRPDGLRAWPLYRHWSASASKKLFEISQRQKKREDPRRPPSLELTLLEREAFIVKNGEGVDRRSRRHRREQRGCRRDVLMPRMRRSGLRLSFLPALLARNA